MSSYSGHKESLKGVIAPILTPFNDDLTIANDLLCDFAHELLDKGCAGLVIFGTTGEAASVAPEDRITALKTLINSGIAPQKLLLGTGMCDLQQTALLTRETCNLGCHGTLMLPPFYYKDINDDGLFAYYAGLIEHSRHDNLRIYLYHIPKISGIPLSEPLVRRLHETFPDIIIGLKDSNGEKDFTLKLLQADNFSVYPGYELYLWDALHNGAPGCITATANLKPKPLAEFIAAYHNNNLGDTANEKFTYIYKYRMALQNYNFIPVAKRYLVRRGYDERWQNIRPPLLPCSENQAIALENDIAAIES